MTDFAVPAIRFASALTWLLLLAVCSSCSGDSESDERAGYSTENRDCVECHDVSLDPPHRLDCGQCHLPADEPDGLNADHPPIIAKPAHPDHAGQTCGQCHDKQTAMVLQNNHYLLIGHLDTVRAAFPGDSPSGNSERNSPYPASARPDPDTAAGLAEDLLSRRCLRCHVYSSGDPFPRVFRGTGCAACHLAFAGENMESHAFIAKPDDDRCLSCHYGNHVGFDYYGRYEHDLNEEYRTPYLVNADERLPYGVEFHQLKPDIHHAAGMLCIDCHMQENVMGAAEVPGCDSCHRYDPDQQDQSYRLPLSTENGKTLFTSAATGHLYEVPQRTHEAHERYGGRFSCQVCHAQWIFNDGSVHLLRIDHEEFDDFYKLSIDGSYEVQRIIVSHVSEDGDLLEPYMTDKFTDEPIWGIWFRGFIERRWERMEFVEDDDGKIRTARPILDMRLSWIDEDEAVRFDNVRSQLPALRSYAPHTIGKADLFFENRIQPFLDR